MQTFLQWKAVSIVYCEYVFLALSIQQAMRMRIVMCVCVCVCVCMYVYIYIYIYIYLWHARLHNIFFLHYLINGTIFEKRY